MLPQSAIYQRVWQFAWPAIISNISVPLLGLVDAGVLGHLSSPEYLGGVAIATTLFSMLFWAFGFLRMGTTGLVAQALGRGDREAFSQWLLHSIILAGVIGVLLLISSGLFFDIALPNFDASPLVAAQAEIYFNTRILSAPAVLINYALIGWLIGMHRPRGPLLILVAGNSINIVLDLLFVIGLGMETYGAALATVIADYAALIIGSWCVWQTLRQESGAFSQTMLRNLRGIRQLLLLNRHLFVRTLCMLFEQAFFTSRGAQMGDHVLAANALLLNLLMVIANGLDGFAHAAEALTGEALGKKKIEAFHWVVRVTGLCSLICGVLFTLAFWLVGNHLLGWLTNIPEVIATANTYIYWLIALPLVAVWCYWLDGVFIGAVRTDMMQHTVLIASLLVFLPIWYLTRDWGNHGLWFAYILFLAARGIGLLVAYRRFSRKDVWL